MVEEHDQRKRILLVFGTRPEAIKMSPVIHELREHPSNYEAKICVSAQHREMLDQVLTLFDIDPDFDLNLMSPNQSLGEITCQVLKGLEGVYQQWRPDWVLVQGDTTTAMAAALAAYYARIPVAHIEAGLRTENIYAPWPEEMNRRQATVLSSFHFAPTDRAKRNLLREGVPEERILVTGNTVVDALLSIIDKLHNENRLKSDLEDQFRFLNSNRKLILVTGHRRESFGRGFENICHALRELGKREDIEIVYPVHLNPNVQRPVKAILGECERVYLIEPQDYLSFVYLMHRSYMIITDSGGIQEEAPSLGKPVLVIRENTERPEAVEAGTVKLVGTGVNQIVSETKKLLDNVDAYHSMTRAHNPYGDGHAASRIVKSLSS